MTFIGVSGEPSSTTLLHGQTEPQFMLAAMGRARDGPFLFACSLSWSADAVVDLVNRCFRYTNPDVGSDLNPVDIGHSHDDFDHPDFNAVRRLDSSAEPERSEAGDL